MCRASIIRAETQESTIIIEDLQSDEQDGEGEEEREEEQDMMEAEASLEARYLMEEEEETDEERHSSTLRVIGEGIQIYREGG
jgi:hypothetical protein